MVGVSNANQLLRANCSDQTSLVRSFSYENDQNIKLDFSNHDFKNNKEAMTELLGPTIHSKALRELNVSGAKFSKDQILCLFDAVVKSTSLSRLDLSGCNIFGLTVTDKLADMVKTCSLSYLNINNNGFAVKTEFSSVSDAILKNKTLKVVDYIDNYRRPYLYGQVRDLTYLSGSFCDADENKINTALRSNRKAIEEKHKINLTAR